MNNLEKLIIYNKMLMLRPYSTTRVCYKKRSNEHLRKHKETKNSIPYQSDLYNPVQDLEAVNHCYAKTPKVYDTKPIEVIVEKYRAYYWCGCGYSREQPFCDLTCGNQDVPTILNPSPRLGMKRPSTWLKLMKIPDGVLGPIKYVAPKSGSVWFCNCKQTNNRPFCDGTHRKEEIQSLTPGEIQGKFELFDPEENFDDKIS